MSPNTQAIRVSERTHSPSGLARFTTRVPGAAPILALGLASLLWGTADVAGKLALEGIPPATLAASRFGVALVVLWPLARRLRQPRVPARVAAPLGLLGVALTFLLENMGLARTGASNASVLQGAVPLLTLLLAASVLKERLGRRRLLSVGASVIGMAAVTLPANGGLHAPGSGDVLVLSSAGCFAGFIVLGRRAFPIYGTFPVLAAMTAWGMAALVPAAAAELWFTRPAAIGAGQAALVLYLGVGCSALTYALWGYALCHLEAGRAAMLDALVPVVGVVTAVLVLRDAPTAWQLAGGALIVAGVGLAVREPDPAPDAASVPVSRPCHDGIVTETAVAVAVTGPARRRSARPTASSRPAGLNSSGRLFTGPCDPATRQCLHPASRRQRDAVEPEGSGERRACLSIITCRRLAPYVSPAINASAIFADESTPGSPAPGWVPAPTK